jgi:hypothetical protein
LAASIFSLKDAPIANGDAGESVPVFVFGKSNLLRGFFGDTAV